MAPPLDPAAGTAPALPSKPKFAASTPATASPLATPEEPWVTVLAAPAYFTLPVFLATLAELTRHPERNSSMILRADALAADAHASPDWLDEPAEAGRLGLEVVDDVRVRLMPRQPGRDSKVDQRTTFMRTPDTSGGRHAGQSAVADGSSMAERGLVLKVPLVHGVDELPWYHPTVRKLAFQWDAVKRSSGDHAATTGEPGSGHGANEYDDGDGYKQRGTISISYLPFASGLQRSARRDMTLGVPSRAPRKRSPLAGPAPPPAAEQLPAAGPSSSAGTSAADETAARDRLHRTCTHLLETLHKHGMGNMAGYQKRVTHDVVVTREPFQDLYLALKERHRHLESRAPKATSTKVEDVKRHVWKDVAIAAFLMLLWKDMYPARERPTPTSESGELDGGRMGDEREWDMWGRPPGGFIDLGCVSVFLFMVSRGRADDQGNGLLVHILISEGYAGMGYELRARRTWPLYPPRTRAALVELPIDMPSWFPSTVDEWEAGEWAGKEACVIKEGSFLIGNHADELTPWLPLLSLLPATPVPHLSLPCCLHTLDGQFTAGTFAPPFAHAHAPAAGFGAGLEGHAGRYSAYVMWLGWCGLLCGWRWEKEALRIPSTRGWGIVEDRQCRAWALEQVSQVRQAGAFKLRVKEGKEH